MNGKPTIPVLRMQTVLLHLERLRRHYEAAVRAYDHVSLLDLSHSLRRWTELKTPLIQLAPRFSTTLAFKTAIPAKKVLRAARGRTFVTPQFCLRGP